MLIELWWFSMSPPCLSFTCSNCVWRRHNSQGYPGYYRGPHWKSMGLSEVSMLDLTILENIQSIFSVSIISQHWLLQEVRILPDANKIPSILPIPRTSCQIRKIAGCAGTGNARNVFPPLRVSNPNMHHGTCVMHVPWCMLGTLTSVFCCWQDTLALSTTIRALALFAEILENNVKCRMLKITVCQGNCSRKNNNV